MQTNIVPHFQTVCTNPEVSNYISLFKDDFSINFIMVVGAIVLVGLGLFLFYAGQESGVAIGKLHGFREGLEYDSPPTNPESN